MKPEAHHGVTLAYSGGQWYIKVNGTLFAMSKDLPTAMRVGRAFVAGFLHMPLGGAHWTAE